MHGTRSQVPAERGAVIFNPRAARALRWRDTIRRLLERGHGYRWLETAGPGHGAHLAREAAQAGADLLVAAGGDGTLHEIVNGVLSDARRPAILPLRLGTGNDFARTLGIPREPTAAVAALHSLRRRTIDVAIVAGRGHFVNAAGFGIDAEVVRRGLRQRRARSYTARLALTVVGHRPKYFELVSEGPGERPRMFRGHALSISIANGSSVGGGYRIAPNADPGDGELDICIFEGMAPLRALANLWKVRWGRHLKLRGFHTWRCRRATLMGEDLTCHLDGEYQDLRQDGTVTMEVVPQALSVLA